MLVGLLIFYWYNNNNKQLSNLGKTLTDYQLKNDEQKKKISNFKEIIQRLETTIFKNKSQIASLQANIKTLQQKHAT